MIAVEPVSLLAKFGCVCFQLFFETERFIVQVLSPPAHDALLYIETHCQLPHTVDALVRHQRSRDRVATRVIYLVAERENHVRLSRFREDLQNGGNGGRLCDYNFQASVSRFKDPARP